MSEVFVNFELEDRDGVVAVGTYLIDAARRLGIQVEPGCDLPDEEHKCSMKVSAGRNLLSFPTGVEMEQLSTGARKNGERLSCQARIEKPGEITIMSVEKNKETKTKEEEKKEGYRKEFEEMPLEQKISNLIELEAIALGETLSFVLNSPFKAAGKVMDVVAGFGLNLEKEDQEAKRPDEHKKNEKEGANDKDESSKKTSKKKATAKKKTTAKDSVKKSADDPADDDATEEKTEE